MLCIYIYIYMNTHTYVCMYTYVYRPAFRKQAHRESTAHTPGPPTKSLDFRGFDSSRLLILRGGNSHVRMNS